MLQVIHFLVCATFFQAELNRSQNSPPLNAESEKVVQTPNAELVETIIIPDSPTFLMNRAIQTFENRNVSRQQLRLLFQSIIQDYPSSPEASQAKSILAQLDRMIVQDNEKKPMQYPDDVVVPDQEKIENLIYSLRDQLGFQWEYPGQCVIFRVNGSNTAADDLLRYGFEAVPYLIKALDDPSFTRAVQIDRTCAHVLRVQDSR